MNAVVLLVLIAGVALVRQALSPGAGADAAGDAIFVAGVLIIGSYLSGELIRRARVPRITGYLLFGIAAGPWVLGLASREAMDSLVHIDELALCVIAFSAGGELKLREIRARLKAIAQITLAQTVASYVLLALILGGVFLVTDVVEGPWTLRLGVALLLAVFAVPKSPATTIAVLLETRARGPLTQTALGVTILKDVLSIVLFAVLLMLLRPLIQDEVTADAQLLLSVLWDLAGSLLIGFVLGGLAILYLRYVRTNLPVFSLGLAFFTMELAHVSGLHSPLLMGIVLGAVVENASDEGDRFIRGLQQSTLPVFMIFFAASGARLNLDVLQAAWGMALLFLIARGLVIWGSTDLACRMTAEPPAVRRNLWTGFLSQAGVSLGFVAVIRETFSGEAWLETMTAMVLAAIVVNQIVGPPLFKWGLTRAGEVEEEG